MIAAAMALWCAQVVNGDFETGTLEGWTLKNGTGGAVVSRVGTLPAIGGRYSGLFTPAPNPGEILTFTSAAVPVGVRVTLSADIRVLCRGQVTFDIRAEMFVTDANGADLAMASRIVTPTDFEPFDGGDFDMASGLFTLGAGFTSSTPTVFIFFHLAVADPSIPASLSECAMLVDNVRVTVAPVTTVFDDWAAHTGRGFAPFQNPPDASCCDSRRPPVLGPPLLLAPAPPRAAERNDGSLHGSTVELHTGSFTFNTFT
jgi:hypothetical protein